MEKPTPKVIERSVHSVYIIQTIVCVFVGILHLAADRHAPS